MRTRNDERSRGAVAVEFAIGGMLLCLMFFGTLEFGLMLRTKNNLTNASREAARTVAALPRQEGFQNAGLAVVNGASRNTGAGSIQYITIYRADPTDNGRPVNGQSFEECVQDCWRYEWADGVGFQQLLDAEWDHLDQQACGDTVAHDWIGVYIRAEHEWVSGFFGDKTRMDEYTVMRLEPMPRGEKCK